MARESLGWLSTLGTLANLFSKRDVGGEIVAPLVPSPVMGGLQAGHGLFDLAAALSRVGSPATRAIQGTGGIANLTGGAMRLFPEAARSMLPAAGPFSPGNVATGLGVASSLAGIGQALARNDKNTGRDAAIGGMGLASAGLGALGGLASLGTGAGLLYSLGPFLTSGLPTLISGPEKPSAASRHEAEVFDSQRTLRDMLQPAQSLPEVAQAFDRVGNRPEPYRMDLPTIAAELQGAQFDPSLGGSEYNLNTIQFLRALLKANPSAANDYARVFAENRPGTFTNLGRAPSGGDELTALNAQRALTGLKPMRPDEWFAATPEQVLAFLKTYPAIPNSTLRFNDDANANAWLAGGGAQL